MLVYIIREDNVRDGKCYCGDEVITDYNTHWCVDGKIEEKLTGSVVGITVEDENKLGNMMQQMLQIPIK